MSTLIFYFRLLLLIAIVGTAAAASAGCAAAPHSDARIGIIQYGRHQALDSCYQGLLEGLKGQPGYTVDLRDGQFDSALCAAAAREMVEAGYDLIIAIATPAATAVYEAMRGSDIPLLFAAVSDPAAAGLIGDSAADAVACSGTADIPDAQAQLALIKALQPEVGKIGVLCTVGESNSQALLEDIKQAAAQLDIKIIEQSVSQPEEMLAAASYLAAKVDCICNLADNLVVTQTATIVEQACAAGIPVYGSEIAQVRLGCLAATGIDYYALGEKTADMALRVLAGENAAAIPPAYISNSSHYINREAAELFGISIPPAYRYAVTDNDK